MSRHPFNLGFPGMNGHEPAIASLAPPVKTPDHTSMNTVVPFKARGARAELREALEQRIPLRILRDRLQPGVIHGYVVALSRDFCLIAEVGDAMRFDGYIVIAIADISALEADPSREFVDKALALRGEQLHIPPDFHLDDWASIARSAARDQLRRSACFRRGKRAGIARTRPECGVVSGYRRLRVRGTRLDRIRFRLSRCVVASCRQAGRSAGTARADVRHAALMCSGECRSGAGARLFVGFNSIPPHLGLSHRKAGLHMPPVEGAG